jgi:hypothetical protein
VPPEPLLSLSAFFDATWNDYHEGRRGITERGNRPRWIAYFLNGVARQSEHALSRAERIDQLLAGWRNKFATGASPVCHHSAAG